MMVTSTEPSPPDGGATTFAAMPELGGDDVEEGAINAAPGEDSAGDGSAGDAANEGGDNLPAHSVDRSFQHGVRPLARWRR